MTRVRRRPAAERLARWCRAHPRDWEVRHWLGLLYRAIDRRDEAIGVLVEANRNAPDHAGILHVLARALDEAGRPAVTTYEQAIARSPADPAIRLGHVAARFTAGDGEAALHDLGQLLGANPLWIEGHQTFAQLAAQLGLPGKALDSLQAALGNHPQSEALHQTAINLLLDAEAFEQATSQINTARSQIGHTPALGLAEATVLDETGAPASAEAFARLGAATDQAHAVRRLRHLIRRSAFELAASEIEPWLSGSSSESIWPYAALIWRANNDPRSRWLEQQEGLVRLANLNIPEPGMEELAACLRQLHAGSGRFLDQSVRNGTQTAGALLSRTEPVIARFREQFRSAIQDYIARLPTADSSHPLLSLRRDKLPRFAGSWSVRLQGAGFHTSHHHPQGWISAAFYVTVPEGLTAEEGRLCLGEGPPSLEGGLRPHTEITPLAGHLAIFPSWMWHGTRPFRDGERMTIAFDIARP